MQSECTVLHAGCWKENQPETGHSPGAWALNYYSWKLFRCPLLPLPPPSSGNPNESIYPILKRIPHLRKGGRFGPYVINYSCLNNLLTWLLLRIKFWLHLKMTLKHMPKSKYMRSPADHSRINNILWIRHLVKSISEWQDIYSRLKRAL